MSVPAKRPWSPPRGIEPVLARWLASRSIQPCIVADETLAGKGTSAEAFPRELAPALARALRNRGIERLYSHQARAFELAQEGSHFVVATPTASGKSLCFHLPVLQAMTDDPDARALYLYPDQGARARPGGGAARAHGRSGAGRRRRRLRRRHPGRRAARGARAGGHRADQPGHAPHRHPAAPRDAGRGRSSTSATSSSTSSTRTKASSGRTSPTCSAGSCAWRAFTARSPQLIGATATIGNPRAHAARLFGVRPRTRSSSRRERGAARASGAFSSSTRRS